MKHKISVIVPVYKAEKFLRRCIDSILAQSFKDFEIILIEDGSPDNCGAVCDEYAQKYSCISVIHKKNGGVTAARADGVKSSTGEWITFVDADDTIPENAFEIFNRNISDGIDIIKGSFNSFGKEEGRIYKSGYISSNEYRSETILCRFLGSAPWGMLIHRNLFNDHIFNIPREIVLGEDYIMHIRLAFVNNKDIKIISEPVYNYIQHEESCTVKFKEDHNYTKKSFPHILNSIPEIEKENYITECIIIKLRHVKLMHEYYVRNNIWRKDEFHIELLKDIKKHNYKLSLKNRIALSISNPITCGIYLFAQKIYAFCLLCIKKLVRCFKK